MAGPYDFGGVTPDQASQAVRNTFNAREAARARTREATQRALDIRYLTRDRTWGEALADTAVGLGQGVVGLGEAAYGVGNLATLGWLERATGLSENFGETQGIMEGWKSDQLAYDKVLAEQTFQNEGVLAGIGEYVTNPALMGDLIATNAPSVLPAAGAGVYAARAVAGGAAARGMTKEALRAAATKKAATAASVTGGAQMGGAAYTEAYRQAITEGLSPEEANQRALATGYATGATGIAISRLPGVGAAGAEGAAAARASGVTGAVGNVARDIVTSGAREASEEYLQSGAEQLFLNAASTERDLLDNVAKSAAMGAVGGAALGVGMGAVRAPSALRQEIEASFADLSQQESGEVIRSNMEQMGDAAAEREAIELQRAYTAAEQRLIAAGFEVTEDGKFVLPNDVLWGDREFTFEEAIELAAESDIEMTDLPLDELARQQAAGVQEIAPETDETLPPLPQVDEGLPLPEVQEGEVGYRAMAKARTALEQAGVRREVRDGQVRYAVSGVADGQETTEYLSEREAIAVAAQSGMIGSDEAAEALRYSQLTAERRTAEGVPAPRSITPVTEDAALTASEAQAQRERMDQDVVLEQSGFYVDGDGVMAVTEDGSVARLSRQEALDQVGYVPASQDLLGDPAATPVTPVAQAEQPGVDVGGLLAQQRNQPQLQGLDPLYDVVDQKRHRAASIARLAELAGAQNLLDTPRLESSPEGELESAWLRALDTAVEVRNQITSDDAFVFNKAMRNSALVRSFVRGAVEAGLDPNSGEAVDYIAEQARAAEATDKKAVGAIAILADMVGANKPGAAPFIRWRKAAIRRKVSKPGRMKGPAYTKFKAATAKAAITPASTEYDSFMQNFSDSLTEKEAASPFGEDVRAAYPKTKTPEQAIRAKAAQATKKAAAKKAAPAKPKQSAVVKAETKTAEEKALTEPAAKLPKKASPKQKAVQAAKVKTKAALVAAQQESEAAEAELNDKARAARMPSPEDLAGDPVDGAYDPEVAAAEREEQSPLRQPRVLSESVVMEVNAIAYQAQQRVDRAATYLQEALQDLRAVYADKNASGEENADAWQRVITDEIGSRIAKLDAALTKDVTDITSWLALTRLVVSDPIVEKYADANTRMAAFVEPMLKRFNEIVGQGRTADALRVYRALLKESGIEQFIEDIGGNKTVLGRVMLDVTHANLDSQLERKVKDPANPANQKPFKRAPRNSRADGAVPAEGRIDPARLRELAARYNEAREGGNIAIEVFDTVAQAEVALGVAMPRDANGVYYNGRAIAIAENIADAETAQDVMLHESTHGGLVALLGEDRLNAVTNRLWANAQIRRRIQAKQKKYNLSRTEAAEEVLVDMVVHGEKLNKSVLAKIRAGINRFADAVFGLQDYVMPDSMVNALLRDTGNYLRGTKYELDMSESYLDGLDAYMHLVDGESTPTGPKFSMAAAAMDDFVNDGTKSTVVKLQDRYTSALGEAIQQNLGGRTKDTAISAGHRIRRMSMDFLPLTQIVNLNEGLFFNRELGGAGTDLLRQFSEDKSAKENDFNKVIQRVRKLTYKGPNGEEHFTASMLDIARQWQKVTFQTGGQADALNAVNQDGTFYKVHPDRDWSQQTALDYSQHNYTEAERRQAHLRVREQWSKLTPENKELYRKAQAAYAALWAERMQELKAMTERIAVSSTDLPDPDSPERSIGTGEWLRKTNKRIEVVMGRISEGPYSPLQRFGEYYVTIRNQKGEVVFNSGHETLAEAEAVRKHMGEQLDEGFTIRTDMRSEFVQSLDGFGKQQFDKVQRAVAGMFPGNDETDRYARANALKALEEVYLQSMPDSNLLTHANARKNIAGATTDSFRAFNDYVIKSARNLSSMRFDHRIQGALAEMRRFRGDGDSTALNVRRTHVLSAVERQHLASQRFQNNALSEGMTQAAFLMWMTSPAQLFLNASQTALVTLPRLAARYGVGQVLKFIGEATSNFVRSKTKGMHSPEGGLDTNGAVYGVLQNLYQDGTLDFTLAHDVSDMAQRDSDLVHSRWREATRAMAIWIHKSEVYNREVAAYTVVRGEMRKDNMTDAKFAALSPAERQQYLNKWTREAKSAVLETQFEYSQSNKAAATQGPVARVVFQFQQFRLNMLAMMAKDVRDSIKANNPSLSDAEQAAATTLARKTLTYMTVTQMLMTGVAGSVLAPVVFGVMKMLQDDDELASPEDQFLQAAPKWLSMGLLSGLLDTQRFGFQSLLPIIGGSRYMPESDDPQDTLDHILLNSLGPAYGLGSQWLNGMKSVAEGNYSRAVTEILPKPFADAYAANVENLDGIKNRSGIAWYQPTAWDRVVNTLGLKSGSQAEAQADRSAIYSGIQRASDRRSKLVGRWVTADNYEARVEAMQEIQGWNRRWGGDDSLTIKRSTLQRAQRTRKEKERIAVETGVPNDRIPDSIKDLIRD